MYVQTGQQGKGEAWRCKWELCVHIVSNFMKRQAKDTLHIKKKIFKEKEDIEFSFHRPLTQNSPKKGTGAYSRIL